MKRQTKTTNTKPKKATKKQIIKDMLVKELRSKEQKIRLEDAHGNALISMDMATNDDELIAIADELHKSKKVLTNKAYLLLNAYKGSAAKLDAYSRLFKAKADFIMTDARLKARWFNILRKESDKLLKVVENKWLAANKPDGKVGLYK